MTKPHTNKKTTQFTRKANLGGQKGEIPLNIFLKITFCKKFC